MKTFGMSALERYRRPMVGDGPTSNRRFCTFVCHSAWLSVADSVNTVSHFIEPQKRTLVVLSLLYTSAVMWSKLFLVLYMYHHI